MIPSLRLPAALTALATVALLGPCATAAEPDASPVASPAATVAAPTPAPTPALSPAQHAAAEELVAAMHTQQIVENANKQMQQSIDQVAESMTKTPNVTPEQTADVQKMREESTALVNQKLGWDTMKEDIIRSYADDFSEAEMKEITAFYRTPTGEKLISKQQPLAEKLNRTMRQKSMMVVPVIRQKLQALSVKLRPAPPVHPVASPGASPAVAPAASPAEGSPAAAATATPPVTSAPVPAPTPVSTPEP